MMKGFIEKIGEVDESGQVTGWRISRGDYAGIDYSQNPPIVCGYTVEELKQIANIKKVLSDQIITDKPITLIIPAGRYHFGVFHS